MQDPTRDDLIIALNNPFANEFDDFDREEAIYWFAHDYHMGQASNLYSVLCMSDYHPGPISNGCSETAQILYDELEYIFA